MDLTLLEIVQDVLSSLDSDQVNSINDNTESLQVANLVRTKYNDIISRGALPEHKKLIQLNASGDSTKPVLMFAPDGVVQIDWLKYYNSNVEVAINQFEEVKIVDIKFFLSIVNAMNTADANVASWTFTEGSYNFSLKYMTDRQPNICAVLENYYILFDAFDTTVDSTLQGAKSMAFAQIVPEFQMVDSFTPDLDDGNFALLLNEVKALAFYEMKAGTMHPLALKEASRQWSSVQKNKALVNKPSHFDQLAYFGRK